MGINNSTEQVNSRLWASRKSRFANWIIDWFIAVFGGYYLIVLLLGDLFWNRFHIDLFGDFEFFLFIYGWWFLYYFICEAAFGKTLGKLITKTKVVTLQGEKPSTRTIALRTLCRLVPFEALSAFRDSETCWHDDWTSTIVITTR